MIHAGLTLQRFGKEFELLVVHAGGTEVALDTAAISGISRPLSLDASAIALEQLLWDIAPARDELPASARVVIVQHRFRDGTIVDGSMLVDAIEGYERVRLAELEPVPAALRAHGAPAWIIGFWKRGEWLMPLVDIIEAFRFAMSEERRGE